MQNLFLFSAWLIRWQQFQWIRIVSVGVIPVLDARLVSDMQVLAITVVSDLACGLAMFTFIFLPESKDKELEAFH